MQLLCGSGVGLVVACRRFFYFYCDAWGLRHRFVAFFYLGFAVFCHAFAWVLFLLGGGFLVPDGGGEGAWRGVIGWLQGG